MAYATPGDLWRRALPPAALFQDPEIEPGTFSDPVKSAGTGLGTLTLDDASNPREAWTVHIRVPTSYGGELDIAGVLNPGSVPQIQISLDAGTTWSRRLTPDANGRVPYQKGGFTVVLVNATSGGSTVNFGTGNAQLQVTPTRAGGTVTITQQSGASQELTHDIDDDGNLTIELGTDSGSVADTTAAALVSYLDGRGLPMTFAYGGTGAGVVQTAAETALPFASFVAGDTWTCTTAASPDVTAALAAAEAMVDSYLGDAYAVPVTGPDAWIVQVVCDLARWLLIQRKGGAKDFAAFKPDAALKWLSDVADGSLKPSLTEGGSSVNFADMVTQLDPLDLDDDGFPI